MSKSLTIETYSLAVSNVGNDPGVCLKAWILDGVEKPVAVATIRRDSTQIRFETETNTSLPSEVVIYSNATYDGIESGPAPLTAKVPERFKSEDGDGNSAVFAQMLDAAFMYLNKFVTPNWEDGAIQTDTFTMTLTAASKTPLSGTRGTGFGRRVTPPRRTARNTKVWISA